MPFTKLTSTDAFITFDLPEAEESYGVTRLAPKVLVDGAWSLARSVTYAFAAFEVRVGGASAGINADAGSRDAAITSFMEEVAPMVAARTFVTDPGVGVREADIAALRVHDPRNPGLWEAGLGSELGAVGAVSAAGDVAGKRVIVDAVTGPELLEAVAAAGGKIVALTTSKGATVADEGLADLRAAWDNHGVALVDEVGTTTDRVKALATPADVLFLNGRAGSLDHEVAAVVECALLVPTAPVPVTARALAVLGRADACVLPDFLTTAAPLLAGFDLDAGDPVERVRTAATGLIGAGPDAWLQAVERAESFLAGWATVPFGRPLA